jgi:nuclear pore complex protein Nup98-Nup96
MSSAFIDRMRVFDIDTVSVRQFRMLKKALASPEFDEATVPSGLIMACAVWSRCIGVYLSLDKFRGGPRVRPVALQPALEVEPDLSRLNEAQLANVEELTVRRAGVGQLTFHGVTDCRGLDLNDIVRLEVGEVLVYPDASQAVKPRPGDGLNKSATVTMFQCWPPNGGSQMQDDRARRRYREKIQQMTERKNAEFIDYDPEQGIWTFRVQHF